MSSRPRRIAAVATLLAGSLSLAGLPAPAAAKVFHAKDEALELAFPEAQRTEPRDFYLTPEQRTEIERRAKTPLESSLVTVYVGERAGEVIGYAIFDTHLVRTLHETFLVVLSPSGAVQATHVLAFHEPLEYLPSERWLGLFQGRTLSDDLQVGHGIAAITGSTLSARAVLSGIRRALAIYEVLLGGK